MVLNEDAPDSAAGISVKLLARATFWKCFKLMPTCQTFGNLNSVTTLGQGDGRMDKNLFRYTGLAVLDPARRSGSECFRWRVVKS